LAATVVSAIHAAATDVRLANFTNDWQRRDPQQIRLGKEKMSKSLLTLAERMLIRREHRLKINRPTGPPVGLEAATIGDGEGSRHARYRG
jgi:hypothetical protein